MSIITLNTRSLPDSAVTTAKIAADAITDAKIADDVVGTEHLTAGEVDATALGADSVTAAKINNDIISGSTELASEPADTDEFLVSDAGTLKRIDYSLIKGGGITEADQWRLTANTNDGTNDVVSSNWERNDSTGYAKIGTGVSESSGVFSFATTGIYFINLNTHFRLVGGDYAYVDIQVTTNNSSYTAVSRSTAVNLTSNDEEGYTGVAHYLLDVTDTSNVKVRLYSDSMSNNTRLKGSSSLNLTSITFIRLGDT